MPALGPWPRKLAQEHVKAIARAEGIRIRWVKGPQWMDFCEAYRVARLVSIPTCQNPMQYLVALHELGHVLGPFQLRHEFPGYTAAAFHLLEEAGADLWSAEHIHDDLDRHIRHAHVDRAVGMAFASHWWAVAVRAREG